jgi:hypothetical protein
MKRLFFVLALLLLPSTVWAQSKAKELKVELAGSVEIQIRMNERATALGLVRIQTNEQYEKLKHTFIPELGDYYLVPIPDGLCVDPRLAPEWRYVMPQVRDFLVKFQDEVSRNFGEACPMIQSAARSVPKQLEIRNGTGTKANGNNRPNLVAARVDGNRPSMHLTGASVDTGKLDLFELLKRRKQKLIWPEFLTWTGKFLLGFEDLLYFDVTEENTQQDFHFTVLPKVKITVPKF